MHSALFEETATAIEMASDGLKVLMLCLSNIFVRIFVTNFCYFKIINNVRIKCIFFLVLLALADIFFLCHHSAFQSICPLFLVMQFSSVSKLTFYCTKTSEFKGRKFLVISYRNCVCQSWTRAPKKQGA